MMPNAPVQRYLNGTDLNYCVGIAFRDVNFKYEKCTLLSLALKACTYLNSIFHCLGRNYMQCTNLIPSSTLAHLRHLKMMCLLADKRLL